MLLTIFLCFVQLLSTSDSNKLVNESKSQAHYYITQIKNGSDIEENLWALTVLGSEKDEIKSFIEENSKNTEILKAFKNFEKDYQSQLKKVVFQTGSPNLLTALLLTAEKTTNKNRIYHEYLSKFDLPSSQDINYKRLFEAIINGNQIKRNFFTNQKFLLPHFFLLWDSNYTNFITETYSQDIITNWNKPLSNTSLHTTLAEISYFRALYMAKNFSKSASLFDSFMQNKLFPNSSLKLKIYQFFDYTMYRIGFYDRSLKIVRNITIPLSEYLNKKSEKLHFTHLQGVYLYSIGKIQEAEKIYQNVLKEIDKDEPQINLSSLYNNLALTYHKLGRYEQFLELQFQALENAKKTDNYSHQLEILNNLFIYYRKSNNVDNALHYLEQAQEIALEDGDNDDLGTIYTSFGSFYRTFKQDLSKAHDYLDKAEEVLDSQNNTRYFIKLLNERAEAYELEKKYEQAISQHDRILELTSKEAGVNYLDALVNKALVNLKMGNIDKTGTLISEYKSHDLSQLEFQQLIKAKTVEADYLQQIGNSQKALDILNPALEQVLVRAKSSADLKTGFWHVEDEYLDAFELIVSIYIAEEEPNKAVEKLDQLKTINDASLYQNPLVKSSLLNESELTEYKQLTEQLDAQRKKLLTAPEDKQFSIRQNISKLNIKKRQLDDKLTDKADQKPTSIRDVQKQLSGRDLVMHITELKDQYYIARITRSDISINTVSLDSTTRDLFSRTSEQIAIHETNLNSLYKISELLGIKDLPNHIEQITVIPDSYLYQFPIDVLPLTNPDNSYSYGGTTYLIEKYRTQYLTSLEGFVTNDKSNTRIENQHNYVGYGVSNFSGYKEQSLVPLPYAQQEVQSIANRLTHLSDIQTFINEASTKATFTKTAPHAQILHLATHSSVSERDPMFSTMYMSKTESAVDSTFDDQIFAYELFELNLNSEMIMLNSCESGSGPYIQGTGVMGMSRALRYAGANSLVLNLWSVNDMLASDFAIHFYDQLNQGKSKSEALQATKQFFLQNKNASPHFWGPYMLIGDPDPIVEPNRENNIAMASIFIFYFLLMVGLSYLKDQGLIFTGQSKREQAKAA